MDLLFLSSDPISLPSLEALAGGKVADTRLVAVITNPDRRSGRGKKVQRNAVAAKADELGLPVHQTPKLTLEEIQGLPHFDAALVFAFGQILPRSILSLRPGLFLNVHASPLPFLRGPSPIETAIAEGWSSTEISLMRMVQRMDAGDIAFRQKTTIDPSETGPSLREKIALQSATLVERVPDAVALESAWDLQDDSSATWCRKISKKDGRLDFSLPAQTLANQSRAFEGWPGSTILIGGETMKVADLSMTDGSGHPGEILSADERLEIATGEGALSIGMIQRPSRKMAPFAEFQRATPVQIGSLLSFPLSQPLVRSKFRL